MPLAETRVAHAAAATLVALGALAATATPASAQFEASDLQTSDETALYLQDIADAQPGQSDVGTVAVDPNTPPWYARGGLFLLFPQDQQYDDVTTELIPSSTVGGGFEEQSIDQDLTLGWGGGLYAAVGYGFAPNERINPRVEAEYQLLLADFRDADDDGITWNSIGVNGLADFRFRENIKLYGGAGAGIAYVSFANPPAQGSSGLNIPVGSDDDVTFYIQALGGALFRFSDDVDIDLGLRYQLSQVDAFAGEVNFDNVAFHVGLLLHLE